MADNGTKRTSTGKRGGQRAEPSLLGSLPSTRPTGLSRRGKAAAGHNAAPERPAPAAAPERPAPSAAPRERARRPPKTARTPRPTAVRPGAPSLDGPPRIAEQPPPPRPVGPPRGTELVTTAIQAAGEIAQIGLTVGGQVLKRAVDRLPKR